jgi:hypothetical protein
VEFSGVVSLTQAEWDAVIQSAPGGGLTRGTIYFLASDFSAEAGRLSATAPSLSGDFVLPLGIALSSTDLLVQIGTRSRNS